MANKLKINQLSAELADRARHAFAGVVDDLDGLLSTLSERLGSGPMPRRDELLKAIRTVRQSLDARLGMLEAAVQGKPARKSAKKSVKKAKKAKKATKRSAAKTVKKAAKKAVKKAAKKAPRKSARKAAKKAPRKAAKRPAKTATAARKRAGKSARRKPRA